MKYRILITCALIFIAVAGILAATSKETAYQTLQDPNKLERSAFKGYMATGTGNVTAYSLGTLYGMADSIEIVSTGDTSFTVTISHLPKKETKGSITWPVAVTKFTKLLSLTENVPVEYGLETLTGNSNVAVGSMFNGDVQLTITDFTSGSWYVNVNTEKGNDPVATW
jgi:hypothetical protein